MKRLFLIGMLFSLVFFWGCSVVAKPQPTGANTLNTDDTQQSSAVSSMPDQQQQQYAVASNQGLRLRSDNGSCGKSYEVTTHNWEWQYTQGRLYRLTNGLLGGLFWQIIKTDRATLKFTPHVIMWDGQSKIAKVVFLPGCFDLPMNTAREILGSAIQRGFSVNYGGTEADLNNPVGLFSAAGRWKTVAHGEITQLPSWMTE